MVDVVAQDVFITDPGTQNMSAILFATTLASFGGFASGGLLKKATPILGWNSYNTYSCSPSESIIKENAKALKDNGFSDLGYTWVTVDCGWDSSFRDNQSRLVWNETLFPSGGKALGDYLHDLGLQFGLYSGAGVYQCGSDAGPDTLLGSLGYEAIDALSFAEWGGDSLKYDNCWPDATAMVQYDYPEPDPSVRFRAMSDAISNVSRPIIYQLCQWGVGENLGEWAPQISNSWRISNDIVNEWKSIWRITNQVVPFWKHTGVGAYADMDMLMIGTGGLTTTEEQFHMAMWAINKSPLIIGSSIIPGKTNEASLSIMKNVEVLAINQDPLGQQARLIRRFTEEEYDIWAGDLSESRKVVAIANWASTANNITFDLSVVGIGSAQNVRDVWAAQDLGPKSGETTLSVDGHGIKLLVLSDIQTVDAPDVQSYYSVTSASLSGSAALTACASSDCLPVNNKVSQISPASTVTFNNVNAGSTGGEKHVAVDFINYEIAYATAWEDGANILNMTIAVNGGVPKRWAFPISGGDWYETGTMDIVLNGFVSGEANTVVFSGYGNAQAPDLVGFAIMDS